MSCYSPTAGINALQVPGVVGDGVHDDTEGLQTALDSGAATVYLPRPSRAYLISRTLVIHSGQTLQADRAAVIRLADGAHAHMLTNADHDAGDENITILGGIWDGNNAHQTCDYHEGVSGQTPWNPARYLGVLFQLNHVTDLRIAHLTLKDPETYGLQIGNVRRFTVEDITFDYNLLKLNMDGVHVHGPAREGRIVNVKGATNDDAVALNADDAPIGEMCRGPISDIQVDGIWGENSYTAVRLLSAGSPVSRVRLSNIYGTYRYYAVSFTHHNVHPGAESTFEDIVMDGVFCAKSPEGQEESRRTAPLIWFAPGTVTRGAHIQNFHRTEHAEGAADSIVVDTDATVDYLAVSDASLINHTRGPVNLVKNAGTLGTLSLSNLRATAVGGAPRGFVVENSGTIRRVHQTNVTPENVLPEVLP